MKHHEETIERLVDAESVKPGSLAVIVTGSVGRGTERRDSDVDVYLVVEESVFGIASATNSTSYADTSHARYEGGYVDVKLITIATLEAASASGDDPVRASLEHSRIAWSRVDRLERLLESIPRRSDDAWSNRLHSQLAQAHLHGRYFLRQAEDHDDPFLLHHAATHLATACGRAVLIAHRRLHQGPKYLVSTLRSIPSLPATFVPTVMSLLDAPTQARADALIAATERICGPLPQPNDALATFVTDNELAWLTRVPPPEYS
jgi:predicted nucleotidyltransferase